MKHMLLQMQLVRMLAMVCTSCLGHQIFYDSKGICADWAQMCKAQQVLCDAAQLHAGCVRVWQGFESCDKV